MIIKADTKITLSLVITIIVGMSSIAIGGYKLVDYHVKTQLDPIEKKIDFMIKRQEFIINYLLGD